ncbi:MAG: hypothetical protein LQ341_007194 [Variospora aurantia]|nr:MAG: hypothetical protein LQ341_007194 [Variospora aurantia]
MDGFRLGFAPKHATRRLSHLRQFLHNETAMCTLWTETSMGRLASWLRLAFSLLLLSALLCSAFPYADQPSTRTSLYRPKNINIKNNEHRPKRLLPRADSDDNNPFLGSDWTVEHMENFAAYVPTTRAAHDLTSFYTSLRIVALYSNVSPDNFFLHRLGRVLITFHATGGMSIISNALILRFADGMLRFTRMGYTCAYRMRFRHLGNGGVLQVVMSVDALPVEEEGQGECEVVMEGEGEVNGSEVRRPVCVVMRPPSFPPV